MKRASNVFSLTNKLWRIENVIIVIISMVALLLLFVLLSVVLLSVVLLVRKLALLQLRGRSATDSA